MARHRKPISYATRFAVLAAAGFRCRYCGHQAPDVVLHIDHVIPVHAGGSSDPRNLVVACSACNLGKSSSAPRGGRERCPGEVHPGPFVVTRYGPRDRPGCTIAINCRACGFNAHWYTPLVESFTVVAGEGL